MKAQEIVMFKMMKRMWWMVMKIYKTVTCQDHPLPKVKEDDQKMTMKTVSCLSSH